jgi:hypothetical protein
MPSVNRAGEQRKMSQRVSRAVRYSSSRRGYRLQRGEEQFPADDGTRKKNFEPLADDLAHELEIVSTPHV